MQWPSLEPNSNHHVLIELSITWTVNGTNTHTHILVQLFLFRHVKVLIIVLLLLMAKVFFAKKEELQSKIYEE